MRDQYDDRSLAVLKKLSTVFELPEFVKEASVVDERELLNIPRSSFGDTVNRKYPLTSKKDVYLSSLYFRKYASEYEDAEYAESVKQNIDKAMELWGVPATVVRKSSMAKKASSPLTVLVRDNDSNVIDQWNLDSPRDFEKAAIQLFENKNMFTFEQRKDVARQLLRSDLKKEAKLSPEHEDYLDKAAAYGFCTKLQLIDTVRCRARLYKEVDERFTEKMAELAEVMEGRELTSDDLKKTASILDFCDRQLGMHERYADLPSPEESLFIFTEKKAEEIKNGFVRLQNGSFIEKTALREETLDNFFDKYIGEIPKVSLEEKVDILASLPSPDADDFQRFYVGKA